LLEEVEQEVLQIFLLLEEVEVREVLKIFK
jgi:hypothetical protein